MYRDSLIEKLKESLGAVLPIVGIVLFLAVTIAPIPNSILLSFLFGGVLLMVREFTIGGKRVRMRASALIPRLYRHYFGRDMMRDMRQLQKAYRLVQEARKGGEDQEAQEQAALSVMDLQIFEDVAWIMLLHGAERVDGQMVSGEMPVGDSPEEWLDSLDGVFDVYQVLPVITELWGANQQTTSVPAKK